ARRSPPPPASAPPPPARVLPPRVGVWAIFPPRRCASARNRPRTGRIRCPVLCTAPPLRVPAVDRALRRRAAAVALCGGVAAFARYRRDGRGIERSSGTA